MMRTREVGTRYPQGSHAMVYKQSKVRFKACAGASGTTLMGTLWRFHLILRDEAPPSAQRAHFDTRVDTRVYVAYLHDVSEAVDGQPVDQRLRVDACIPYTQQIMGPGGSRFITCLYLSMGMTSDVVK